MDRIELISGKPHGTRASKPTIKINYSIVMLFMINLEEWERPFGIFEHHMIYKSEKKNDDAINYDGRIDCFEYVRIIFPFNQRSIHSFDIMNLFLQTVFYRTVTNPGFDMLYKLYRITVINYRL